MFEWSELRNMESRVDDDNSAANCMSDLQVCMSSIIIKGVGSWTDACIIVWMVRAKEYGIQGGWWQLSIKLHVRFTGLYHYPRGWKLIELMHSLMFEWSELRIMESRVDDDNSASNCMSDLQVCIIIQGGLEVNWTDACIDVWMVRAMDHGIQGGWWQLGIKLHVIFTGLYHYPRGVGSWTDACINVWMVRATKYGIQGGWWQFSIKLHARFTGLYHYSRGVGS